MNEKQLDVLTTWLKEHIFMNDKIMFNDVLSDEPIDFDNVDTTVIDIIATLHNIIYQLVTGEKYDYMWHWCNKIGSDCDDNTFNELLKEGEHNENT